MIDHRADTPSVALHGRWERIRASLDRHGAACLVTTGIESFAYLTGSWIATLPWLPTRRVFAVLDGQSAFVVVSSLQSAELRGEGLSDIVEYAGDDVDPSRALFQALRDRGLLRERVAVEFDELSREWEERLFAGLGDVSDVTDASPILTELRLIKDESEVAELSRVGNVVSQASLIAAAGSRAGDTELDLARRIADHALSESAFDGFLVVTSGPRTALTHGSPTQRRLAPGDAVRVDIIRRSPAGYIGDIARTMFVGQPSELQRAYFDATLHGLDAAVAALVPGEPLSKAFNASEDAVRADGFEMSLTHVGHSIGLTLHEEPLIEPTSNATCVPGMVVCVEVILESDSGEWYHLEELVHVTAEGPVRLAGNPSELAIIDA